VTRYLLDVNTLIALIDPAHVQHERAHDWFASTAKDAWATCPLTENRVARIIGQPRYPNSPGSPEAVADLIAAAVMNAQDAHEFWPDDFSLFHNMDTGATQLDSGLTSDTYLLALACAHGGKLATFDRHLPTHAVVNGANALHVIW
jgi:toxin-antitoxin system PIN domain toxin